MLLKKLQRSSPNRQGFALILLAALLVIAGIATSMLLMSQEQERLLGPKQETNEKLQEIATALAAYQRENHALPCPADLGLDAEAPDYGTQEAPCAITAPASNTFFDGVQMGGVPIRALNIPTEYAADAWGNRILYAVSASLTDPLNFTDSDGTIEITDGGKQLTTTAAWALLSHGENGSGAYSIKSPITARDPSCANAGRDAQNCPSQIVAAASGVAFLKIPYNMERGTDYFDDVLAYSSADQQAKIQNRSCINVVPIWASATSVCRANPVTMEHGEQNNNVPATLAGSGQADIVCKNGKLIYSGTSCAP